MFFKKIREMSGINPKGVTLAHEISDEVWLVLNMTLGRGVSVQSSLQAQGVIHGVIAYYAATGPYQEKGVERAAIGEFYRINFPSNWRNITGSIAKNINSEEYQSGLSMAAMEIEKAEKFI
jgi:hypothetical protein